MIPASAGGFIPSLYGGPTSKFLRLIEECTGASGLAREQGSEAETDAATAAAELTMAAA